jgi:hypothetical protein
VLLTGYRTGGELLAQGCIKLPQIRATQVKNRDRCKGGNEQQDPSHWKSPKSESSSGAIPTAVEIERFAIFKRAQYTLVWACCRLLSALVTNPYHWVA